jgi:ribosomal protein L19
LRAGRLSVVSNQFSCVNNSALSGKRLLSTTTTSDISKGGELAPIESSSSSSVFLKHKKIVDLQDRDFLHHKKRPRFRDYEKFKSPRKRASKLLLDLTNEAMNKSKTSNPAVWETKFRVGDAIEMEVISQGGIPQKGAAAGDNAEADMDATAAAADVATDDAALTADVAKPDKSDKTKKNKHVPTEAQQAPPKSSYNRNLERIRGVVLGIFKKKMDTSVLIRDVLFGVPIERLIPLHSPLIQSLRVLEKNFVFKGKKRIKRAKL